MNLFKMGVASTSSLAKPTDSRSKYRKEDLLTFRQ